MPAAVRSLLILALLLLPSALLAQEVGEDAEVGEAALVRGAVPAELRPAELPPADETKSLLGEILARPEFADAGEEEAPQQTLLERFLKWIESLLGAFGLGGMGWQGVVLVTALLFGVAILLFRLYVSLVRSRAARPADTPEAALPATAEGLLALAHKAAAAADYRSAVRYLFNAAVKRLNMPASSLSTNYQVLALARREHAAAVSALTKLIVIFEDAWYGGRPCGQGEYAQSAALFGDIDNAVAGEIA